MRYPPPSLPFFVLPIRIRVFSIRLYSSVGALCAIESNTESTFRLQESFEKLPNERPKTKSRERIEKNLDGFGKNESEFTTREERLRFFSSVLHVCALKGSLNEGKAVHGQVIKSGLDPDAHLWNSLVNAYAKCGSHQCGRQVLGEMLERDVVSWTALISGLVDDGYGRDGIGLFCDMRKDGVRPTGFTFVSALKGCSMCLDIDLGEQIHGEVIKIGHFYDIFVGSSLVDFYAKCGEMELAKRVSLSMPELNCVTWSALLNGYARMGEGEEVLKLFSAITEFDIKFSYFTLSNVIKGCANSGKLREAQSVHSMAIKVGCAVQEYVGCSLLNMYSKFGLSDDALEVFLVIEDPNKVAWSEMINCFNQQGQGREAVELFSLMRHKGIRPNQFTLTSLVTAATNLGDQHFGESIRACIFKYGFASEKYINNALVVMYMKLGSFQKGWLVFDTIIDRDLASWNALLSGFDNNGTCDQGSGIFKRMLLEGFMPDMYTFCSILRQSTCLSDIKFGKQAHAHVVKVGFSGNRYVGTALINMYSNNRCLEDAIIIFSRLHEKDLLTWTVIIAAYAQNDEHDKVAKCFNQMQQSGLKPNEFTLSSCLSGCSNLTTSETGRQFHSLALKFGISTGAYVGSALVDMYVKCRSIEDAESVFKAIMERDIVSWNTIIYGYAQHGKGDRALEAFQLMLDEGFVPDEVTFIGVLSACSHMGLVEEGKSHFESLNKVYGITPTIEHHALIVNIFCRAGKFHEAENFIEEMELAQNTLILETVLWGSKMHGNVEFGQKAAKKLFDLEPEIDYNYVMLSDIFAAQRRWDGVAKVRALMSSQGIKKEPGCSWVKIDAQARLFFAQDVSEPKINEICCQLGKLV